MMRRLCRQLRMNKKSKDRQPIVHRHNNNIAMRKKLSVLP
jgi:hypothetical protein